MGEESKTTTLDYIDNVVVPGEVFREPANEYWALVCTWHGMEFLNRQVLRAEEQVKANLQNGAQIFSFTKEQFDIERLAFYGNAPEVLQNIHKPLLTIAFHWYAISACQFVRLVGRIAWKQDNQRLLPQEYAKAIIPEVISFRDKVAAHFAWSTENTRDNSAERLASIIPPLGFSRSRFRAGAMQITLRQGGEVTNSKSIEEWSLTEVHEQLIKRYLPPPKSEDSPPDIEGTLPNNKGDPTGSY